MKTRNDFVSNSSSSSFIVIAEAGIDCTSDVMSRMTWYAESWHAYEVPDSNAKHEFGWEFETTSSFAGKLNFIGIQLLSLFIMKIDEMQHTSTSYADGEWSGKDFDRCYNMLKKVCKDKFGFNVKLNDSLITTSIVCRDNDSYVPWIHIHDDYYIDHQSSVVDGQCMEMFESEDKLHDFLRFENSCIEGGNDND